MLSRQKGLLLLVPNYRVLRDLGHAHDDGIQKRGVEATDYKILQGYYNRHSSLSLDITGMGHHGSSDMR